MKRQSSQPDGTAIVRLTKRRVATTRMRTSGLREDRLVFTSRLLLSIGFALSFQLSAGIADAQSNESSWSSFTELSVGASVLSNRSILNGDPGFTFGIAQGIRYNRFLFSLGFDGSYYIVDASGPPLSRGLRIFDVKPSIGYLGPVGPLSISGEAFYELRQFRSNGILLATGDDPVQHGIGLASTIRYPATRSLFIALRPYYGITLSTDSRIHELGALIVIGFSATID